MHGDLPSYIEGMSLNEMPSRKNPRAPGPGEFIDVAKANLKEARFGIGDVVRHRLFPFRGVVFDVDPQFANTEEWWQSIPEELRPERDQPFYHLLADNEDSSYVAYVSQQNLVADQEEGPVEHPAALQMFDSFRNGRYILRRGSLN